MLEMHRFGHLNTLVPGHYILRQLIRLSAFIWLDPGTRLLMKTTNHLLTVKRQQNIVLYINLGDYIVEFMQKYG